MLSQERIMVHYSLFGDSNVAKGKFLFFLGGGEGVNINVAFRIRKKGNKKERWIFLPIFNTLGLDCSRLGEDNPG